MTKNVSKKIILSGLLGLVLIATPIFTTVSCISKPTPVPEPTEMFSIVIEVEGEGQVDTQFIQNIPQYSYFSDFTSQINPQPDSSNG